MKKYRVNSEIFKEIEAVQVTEDMLVSPSPIPGTSYGPSSTAMYLHITSTYRSAYVGDWIVKLGTDLRVVTNDFFEQFFLPASK